MKNNIEKRTSNKYTFWVYSIILATAILLVVIFFQPLKDWFFIEKISGDQANKTSVGMGHQHGSGGGHAGHSHSHGDAKNSPSSAPAPTSSSEQPHQHTVVKLPRHDFSAKVLADLSEIFSDTEVIRTALAEDRLNNVADVGAKIAQMAKNIREDAAGGKFLSIFDAIVAASNSFKGAQDLEEARKDFSSLSKSLFELAKIDPRLQKGWYVFSCPMAKDFPKWMQREKKLQNPYMGQKMLMCGSADEWTPAEPSPEHQDAVDPDEIAYYTCPMHPSVRKHEPGSCPICHMDLTPVSASSLKSGEIVVDEERRERIGVKIGRVEAGPLKREIRLPGEVTWDESLVYDVTARVEGWVENLKVGRVGDPVTLNEVLLYFYSPDLLATQRELLVAPPNSVLAASTTERLKLLGMSTWEVKNLLKTRKPRQKIAILSPATGIVTEKKINEGGYVAPGALLYRIVDPKKVWVIAEVFEQDLPYIEKDAPVQIQFPNRGGEILTGKISYIYQELTKVSRTTKVRIEVENKKGDLRPGMMAEVLIEVGKGKEKGDEKPTILSVPADAVIFTGTRRLVFKDVGGSKLRPIEVETGGRFGDKILIIGGLKEGDRIVTSGVFLLAAESRIRSATDLWDGSDEDPASVSGGENDK